MTDDRLLSQSSIIRESYFSRMLDCDPYDRWVEIAPGYLPGKVFGEHKGGPWRLSKTPAPSLALPATLFRQMGLPDRAPAKAA